MKNYSIIKKHKTLELLRLNAPIMGGHYAIRCTKAKKAKTGLCLDAAVDIFYKCII
jgi:hypothetical protein